MEYIPKMEKTQRDGRITWDGTSVAAWNTQRVEQAKRDGTSKGWNKQRMGQSNDGTSTEDGTSTCRVM
jgi:hypothetical protein